MLDWQRNSTEQMYCRFQADFTLFANLCKFNLWSANRVLVC